MTTVDAVIAYGVFVFLFAILAGSYTDPRSFHPANDGTPNRPEMLWQFIVVIFWPVGVVYMLGWFIGAVLPTKQNNE